jgi:hypothetical protein
MTPNDSLPEHWAEPQFTADELSLIAHIAGATLSLFNGTSIANRTRDEIKALQGKAVQLAFNEISRNETH